MKTRKVINSQGERAKRIDTLAADYHYWAKQESDAKKKKEEAKKALQKEIAKGTDVRAEHFKVIRDDVVTRNFNRNLFNEIFGKEAFEDISKESVSDRIWVTEL